MIENEIKNDKEEESKNTFLLTDNCQKHQISMNQIDNKDQLLNITPNKK